MTKNTKVIFFILGIAVLVLVVLILSSRVSKRSFFSSRAADSSIKSLKKTLEVKNELGDESRRSCDLNYDGWCNGTDVDLFGRAFGSCLNDSEYSVFSDADSDGCVTQIDQQILFGNLVGN